MKVYTAAEIREKYMADLREQIAEWHDEESFYDECVEQIAEQRSQWFAWFESLDVYWTAENCVEFFLPASDCLCPTHLALFERSRTVWGRPTATAQGGRIVVMVVLVDGFEDPGDAPQSVSPDADL